jgi:hypothetical protein
MLWRTVGPLVTLAATLCLGGCGSGSPSGGPDGSTGGLDGPATGGGDGGGGASASCWAEDPAGAPPATPACSSLPYATQTCPATGGGAATKPPGLVMCEWYRPVLKSAAFRELATCLMALPGGVQACSPATDFAAFECFTRLQKERESCISPAVSVDGQSLGCQQLVDMCTTNTAEMKDLTLTFCNARLDPFSSEGRRTVLACYRASTAPLCNTRLNRCTQPPPQ